LTEYRDGFSDCADCQIPLEAGLLPQPGEQPPVELVTVLETGDPFALSLAKASLEDAGIDYFVDGNDPSGSASSLGVCLSCPSGGCCRIQVARESEGEARELLEPLRDPSPIDEADVP
jgi:Putative prokaryotic signal transducing protein